MPYRQAEVDVDCVEVATAGTVLDRDTTDREGPCWSSAPGHGSGSPRRYGRPSSGHGSHPAAGLAGWLVFSHLTRVNGQQTRHLHEPGLPSTGLHGRPRVPGAGDFLPEFLPRTPLRSRPRSPNPLSYRRFASTLRSRRTGLPKLTVRVRFPSSAPTKRPRSEENFRTLGLRSFRARPAAGPLAGH
jgi:hypothetical protein